MILVWDSYGGEFDTLTTEAYKKAVAATPGRFVYVGVEDPAEEDEQAAIACIEQTEKFYLAVQRAFTDFAEKYGVTSPQLEFAFKKGAQAAFDFFTADP